MKPRKRNRDVEVPMHRPKRILSHMADEYADLGNHEVAAELRRHLRPCVHAQGGMTTFIDMDRARSLARQAEAATR